MNQYVKNKKGITLLTLVIMIIVLIILSGVAISVLGKSGLIAKAKEQKIIQAKAEILEQLEMEKMSVLNYDTLYTDLGEYIKHIQKENLRGHKVTDVIEKDTANAEIVVDGKYVYKVAQIGNDVVINAEGYIEELDPQIDSFIVKNKNTSKIEVEAKVRRAEKYEFWILKNDKWEKSGTEKTEKMDSNVQKTITYEYTGLTTLEQGQKYQLKIVAKRGNNRQVEKIIDSEIENVEVAEGNLIFDIQPTEWTNKEIITKIYKKTDEEGKILKNLENLTIQYQINGTAETLTDNSKWIEYTTPIVTDKNIVIWVRLWDGINVGSVATRTITKIDKLAPTGSIKVETTTNSAKVTVTAKDKTATSEDGMSGIKGYYYSKDGGKTYNSITTDTSYTFTNLTQSTSLNIKVKVEDNAGNVTEITESGETSSTLKVANLSITVTEPDKWTKGTKTITITPSNNNYSKIRYTLDGTIPTTSSTEYTREFTVNKNCTIIALAFDSTNQIGASATNTVTKIDKLAPTGSIKVETTTNSAKVTVTAKDKTATSEDGMSGIKGYYYSKDGGKTYNSITTDTSYTFTNLTQSTSLNIKVKVEDNAGNVTEITESGETSSTLKVANLSITVTEPDKWTNGTKTITITPSNNNYSKIRYTLDGTIPTTSSIEYTKEFTVNKNCTIIALAFDSTNQIGASATNTVTKIDSKAPIIKTDVQYVSQTVNSTIVKLKAIDTESGISTIKWYYKTSSQSSYNESQNDIYVAMNGTNVGVKTEQEKSHVFSSLSCGITYNIYAEVYDVAGNMIRTPTTGSIDITINHVYRTKTTTSEYLKSNATCTEVAVYYYKCDGCSKKGTTTYTNGDILGHDFTSSQNGTKKSDATCTEPATYYDKCIRCGANATTYHNSGNALGHTGNEGGTITQYTSCTADGWRWYRCTRCHQDYSGTYKYENAWGHSMGAFYSVSYDKYKHHRVCSRCSYEETDEHSFRFGYPNGRTSNGAYIYCACDNHRWGVRFNTTYPNNSEYWAQFNYDHRNESASPSKDFGNRGIEDWWY